MRELVFGVILAGAAGLGVYFMPLKVPGDGAGYAMGVKDARLLLGKADLREGKLPFGRLDMTVTSPSENVVSFAGSGSFAAIDCRATLSPVDGGVTVATDCNGGSASDGAASSAVDDMHDLAFAEFVDAALDQRDEHKVQMQTTGAVMKNMPKMQKEALKMQRDMAEFQHEMEQDAAYADGEDAEVGSGDDWAAE